MEMQEKNLSIPKQTVVPEQIWGPALIATALFNLLQILIVRLFDDDLLLSAEGSLMVTLSLSLLFLLAGWGVLLKTRPQKVVLNSSRQGG